MSRIITFSRQFPSYHPRAGEPTYFVEKILNYTWDNVDCPGFNGCGVPDMLIHLNPGKPELVLEEFNNSCNPEIRDTKHHTIRAGHRFKAGDWFTPKVWGTDINPKSGRSGPYHSKQIQFAPDIQIKKVWDFEIKNAGLYINGVRHTDPGFATRMAGNDGLTMDDFLKWFQYPKPFDGQIICWGDMITY